jgi:hypothetical protein
LTCRVHKECIQNPVVLFPRYFFNFKLTRSYTAIIESCSQRKNKEFPYIFSVISLMFWPKSQKKTGKIAEQHLTSPSYFVSYWINFAYKCLGKGIFEQKKQEVLVEMRKVRRLKPHRSRSK